MADNTHIEWTQATWNIITGCTVHSGGCTNCYAMKLAGTRLRHHESRAGLTVDAKAGPVWNGQVRFNEQWLDQPLRWKRPRTIFVCAHGDLFHESVPDEWIDRVFAVMALCSQHTFQVLTKRSARMREYMSGDWWARMIDSAHEIFDQYWRPIRFSIEFSPLPNVWLGVSVEDQARADERIPDLLATPAAVRWLSCEPLLGPVDLSDLMFIEKECPNWEMEGSGPGIDPETGAQECCTHCDWTGIVSEPAIDWIVAGGESGAGVGGKGGARPMHPDWARSLRDQCAAAGVPFFFKQWGEWGPDTGPDDDHDRDGFRRDRIMEGAVPCAAWTGERWQHADDGYVMPVDAGQGEWVYRLGKRRNGRLLDGLLHDSMPERAA